MSWGLTLMPLPTDIDSVYELPSDYRPEPIGPLATVHARLRAALPELDLTNPAVGELLGPTWVIEVCVGADDPVDAIGLRVLGSGDEAVEFVHRIARAVACRAVCHSQGDLIAEGDVRSWRAFQGYRDDGAG